MAIVPYYTDNGSVFIRNAAVTEDEFNGIVTELSISPGTRDIDVSNTFASSFVNEKRPDLAEVTMTVVASGGDLPLYIMGGSGTDAYPRVYTGDSTRVKPDVKFVQFDRDNGAQKGWVFSGAYVTELSESNTTDEATTWDLTFKTTAANTSYHWTPDAAGSPITII